MQLTTKRIVFVGLDQEGYPVKALELIGGTWIEVSVDVYNSIPTDVYHIEDSAGSEDFIWTDGGSFAYDTCVDAGSPPSEEEAGAVFSAYLQHLRAKNEDAQLDGLAFVYEVSETE